VTIEHKPIEYFLPDYRVNIKANVKSYSSRILTGRVYFKSPSREKFFSVSISCNKNECNAVLPAPSKKTKTLEYFIAIKTVDGQIYKTQVFSVPQRNLPSWQIDSSNRPLVVYKLPSEKELKNIYLEGFKDRMHVQYVKDIYSSEIEHIKINEQNKTKISQEQNQKENKANQNRSSLIPLSEYKIKTADGKLVSPNLSDSAKSKGKVYSNQKVDLTGVWLLKRNLSTCKSNVSAQKMIRIVSLQGVITNDYIAPNGTQFYYDPQKGFVCKLIDDSRENILVGEKSSYTYGEFLDVLKSQLEVKESVNLNSFNSQKIAFEIVSPEKKFWTIYLRQPESSFVRIKQKPLNNTP
jgi:hypothetical protein